MASFNKITIVGYLGRDPEMRYTPDSKAVCTLNVATTEKRKDVTGTVKENTTWFRVTLWERQAELANEYLRKGAHVYVEGRLSANEYTDRDGAKRTSLDVRASDVQFLSKIERATEPKGATHKKPANVPSEVDEDDIPF